MLKFDITSCPVTLFEEVKTIKEWKDDAVKGDKLIIGHCTFPLENLANWESLLLHCYIEENEAELVSLHSRESVIKEKARLFSECDSMMWCLTSFGEESA